MVIDSKFNVMGDVREMVSVPQIDPNQTGKPPIVLMMRDDFNRIGAERIAELEKEYDVRIEPTDEMPPESEDPFVVHVDPINHMESQLPVLLPAPKSIGKLGGNKTPKFEPDNYKKKKKSKRHQQKQSRKNGRKKHRR
jgi:hypothetical protein